MRRHVFVGRFGPLDNEVVETADDQVVTRVDFVAADGRLGYGISRAIDDLQDLGLYPSEIGLDLLLLAAHVHAADTRISRKTESQDSWTREIDLVVPVSDPARWSVSTRALTRLLNFLTGDRWVVSFRPRPASFARIAVPSPMSAMVPHFDTLSLFSGGLDSLIGVIDVLEEGGKPLLISHAGEGATSDAQNKCFGMLRDFYGPHALERLRVWINFPKKLVQGVKPENTTRGRSFLFFALGVFAGTALGRSFTLRVPENGLIALNVPLDPLRLGSLSTRTTHPFYMSRWNDLLVSLGIPGRVENPYWNATKGEMATACANSELLRAIVPHSLSCSAPTKGRWRGDGIGHCGHCLPCLIRRAALEAAFGSGSDPTPYAIPDLTTNPLNSRRAQGHQVRSFQFAIERLKQDPGLAKLLIHKAGPLSDEDNRLSDLAEVYLRGMNEVAALLVNVHSRPG